MEICGAIKSYEWGAVGNNSKVAQLALNNDEKFQKEFGEQTPFAELWMGDHVSGPSVVKLSGESLIDFVNKDKSVIGQMEKLPFLFKVLSINKPLSIQTHPNKEQAERLHAARPDVYKDPNHKPELAIALTEFNALCGFRTYDDLHAQLTKYQPLTDLIGRDLIDQLKTAPTSDSLRNCYTKLMHSSPDAINACIAQLSKILEADASADRKIASTFRHCNHHFPNDVGTLSIFFLNILHLSPGQAIFLSANVPHAYLSGDCIECMACSDNVIRAGLTPKFKDVETLLESLNYDASTPEEKLFQSIDVGPHSQLFAPPVKDFAVVKVAVPKDVGSYAIENRRFGSIFIVLEGQATANDSLELKAGSVIFLPATVRNLGLKITAGPFVAYQALYNDF